MSFVDLNKNLSHEYVRFFDNSELGVTSIIAVHSTALGPALGGCRMHAYASVDEALFDVLRLSEGMTYKNSLCGINFGGGKAVIIADRALSRNRDRLFNWFGESVEACGGKYITAEDMGTSVDDMSAVLKTTKYVAGKDQAAGGGGDPSPFTARGVFEGIRACLQHVHGSSDVSGRTVAVQGVGHVGYYLAKYLRDAGAKVIVADIRDDVAKKVAADLGGSAVASEKIVSEPCDVFSPCAIGGVLNDESVKTLRCGIVAGAANNQIYGENVAAELQSRGIVYAPDFAINSGGVILCADEFEPGGFTESRVLERVEGIFDIVKNVLEVSSTTKEHTSDVALRLAKDRIGKTNSPTTRS